MVKLLYYILTNYLKARLYLILIYFASLTKLIGSSVMVLCFGPFSFSIPWIWLWPNLMAAVAKLFAIAGLAFSLYPVKAQ